MQARVDRTSGSRCVRFLFRFFRRVLSRLAAFSLSLLLLPFPSFSRKTLIAFSFQCARERLCARQKSLDDDERGYRAFDILGADSRRGAGGRNPGKARLRALRIRTQQGRRRRAG